MLTIRDMRAEDKEEVLSMVFHFYKSDAVDHHVDEKILERTFEDAVGDEPILRGVVMEDENGVVGYSYLTFSYACETGGRHVMLEEIYMKESSRGKGYGSKFFEWMFREYPEATRFRLEVTDANRGAAALYERLGFKYLHYGQMVLDRV